MMTMHALNSILGLYIILVLVLVVCRRNRIVRLVMRRLGLGALSDSRAAGRRGSPADFFKVRDLTRAADFFHSPFQT